jgi:hypothetical protein
VTQPKRIDGRARTVRELLDGARYTIDFYQREYACSNVRYWNFSTT